MGPYNPKSGPDYNINKWALGKLTKKNILSYLSKVNIKFLVNSKQTIFQTQRI